MVEMMAAMSVSKMVVRLAELMVDLKVAYLVCWMAVKKVKLWE